MSELTLFVFRIAFLVLLWVFVFFVIYAVRSDLFGQKVRRLPATARATAPDASAFLTQAHSTLRSQNDIATGSGIVLTITAGPKKGERLELGSDPVTIGRASDSTLVIRDEYTSTRHAVLEQRQGVWHVTDLGSTNGTLVDGGRISRSTPLHLGTEVAVGQTVFELRAAS